MRTLLILIMLLPFSVVADDDLNAYHLQNTTSNLLSLDQKIITLGMGLVFSVQEQKELQSIVSNKKSAEIQKEQKQLIEISKVQSKNVISKELEKSYLDCKNAQEFVLLEETFQGMDFLLRNILE
ncbi:MAG: hypothetical protein PHR47_02755 [Candidatus Pacebacteria bacterium]|nr:hypothetical protein [Candidatus Paceibacterota bacterium]